MTRDTPHVGRRVPARLGPAAAVCLVLLTVGCDGGGHTRSSSVSLGARPSASGGATPSAAFPPTGAGSQAPVPVESNPPGDIPDSVAYVPYRNPAGGYAFTYPEGWARAETGTAVVFTGKLDGISADSTGAPAAPTVQAARALEVPRLQASQPAFELSAVEAVTLPGGQGVRVVYRRNSAPDPVTGRQVRDEVESYLVARGGRQLRLDLYGPVGSDNVDAYRTISRSLRLS